jgi:formylglycine-generating enzyme required for sulfatase activity
MITQITMVAYTNASSQVGTTNQIQYSIYKVPALTIQNQVPTNTLIQYSTNLSTINTTWITLTNLMVTNSLYWFFDFGAASEPSRFYRLGSPVNPEALDHFAISAISSPQTAGTAITGITITAQDANNNTVTSFSGAGNTVTYSGTAGITGTSGNFSSGQLTGVSVTPITAGDNETFIVSGSGKTGTATFDVNPGALDHFAISAISSPQTAGTPITGITLTAQDANKNTVTSFSGAGNTVTYSGTAGVTGTSGNFSSGQLTGVSVTPITAGSSKTFIVTGSGETGTATFNVNPGAISQLVMNPTTIASATVGSSVSGSFVGIMAEDAYGNVCGSGPNAFTGTVTFGGTAGATATSALFTAGVLTSFPPLTVANAGSGLTVTATSGSVVGTTIITTVSPLVMMLIPAGSFTMGDANDGNLSGKGDMLLHTNYVSAFYIEPREVTYEQWLAVYVWAQTNHYSFDDKFFGKGQKHPVVKVSWYDAIKWCNARSEKEKSEGRATAPCYYTNATRTDAAIYRSGKIDLLDVAVDWSANGYRLPTEAEWEKAARGGLSNTRFPWASPTTISHTEANFFGVNVDLRDAFDKGPVGYIPQYQTAPLPYTSPVGSFATNNYGLFDMAGNVREWCWDWYLRTYYSDAVSHGLTNNPHGPLTKPVIAYRVMRGGSYDQVAASARCADRDSTPPTTTAFSDIGFRCVRTAVP